MLGSDLIGFQCSDYLLNFLDCCERGLRTRVDRQLGLVDHGAGGQTGLGRQVGYLTRDRDKSYAKCGTITFNQQGSCAIPAPGCPLLRVRAAGQGGPAFPAPRPARRAGPANTAILSFTEPHQVVLSVDTLDFTKGLQHRVAAWERLLDRYHIHRGAATLVQARHVTLAAGGVLVCPDSSADCAVVRV